MKKITERKEKYPERTPFYKFFLFVQLSSQVKIIIIRLMIGNAIGFQIQHFHVALEDI